jgi:hypothetical protein
VALLLKLGIIYIGGNKNTAYISLFGEGQMPVIMILGKITPFFSNPSMSASGLKVKRLITSKMQKRADLLKFDGNYLIMCSKNLYLKENVKMKNGLDSRQQQIAEALFENAGRLKYGSVAVILKIHEGRVVGVTHTVTETTRQKETWEEK